MLEKEFIVLLSRVVTNPANIDGSPIARNRTKALSQNDIVSCITCDINQLEPVTWHYTSQVNDRLTTQNLNSCVIALVVFFLFLLAILEACAMFCRVLRWQERVLLLLTY